MRGFLGSSSVVTPDFGFPVFVVVFGAVYGFLGSTLLGRLVLCFLGSNSEVTAVLGFIGFALPGYLGLASVIRAVLGLLGSRSVGGIRLPFPGSTSVTVAILGFHVLPFPGSAFVEVLSLLGPALTVGVVLDVPYNPFDLGAVLDLLGFILEIEPCFSGSIFVAGAITC